MQVSFEVPPRDGAIDETIRWAGKQREIHLSIREGRKPSEWLGDPKKKMLGPGHARHRLKAFLPQRPGGS
jgi:hypothetical protein